jgi:ATP-dependent exoDNAse (exonuclease V) beta subunit
MKNTKGLKDGDHVWEEWGRGYYFEDNIYPGISSILSKTMPEAKKKSLADWRARIGDEAAEEICNEARSTGTRWHNFLDSFAKKDYISAQKIMFPDTDVQDYYAQAKNFLLKFASTTSDVLTELPIYSHQHKYAGTFDCLVTAKGENVLLDWKTSMKLKKREWIEDYFLQVAAYAHALGETKGITVNRASIVIFYSFQEPDIYKLSKDDLAEQFELFKDRLRLFQELFRL